jgi:hypothetical protein
LYAPDGVFARLGSIRADRIALRLLCFFAAAGQAYSTDILEAVDPTVEGDSFGASSQHETIEEGRRSGTPTTKTTRKPLLLLRLFGLLLLRFDARALSELLFQEPPRSHVTENPAVFIFRFTARPNIPR